MKSYKDLSGASFSSVAIHPRNWTWMHWCLIVCLGLAAIHPTMAQETKPLAEGIRELEVQQKQLAQRFGKLEELFLRMGELEAAANPTRAALLMQAAQMSKQLATLQRLNTAGELLSQGQFTRAIQEQEAGRENLKKLLELLQSENRSSRIKDERKRIEEIQKEIQRLEQIQRGQTARTESGQDLKQGATDQKDIKEQLEKVESDLEASDRENESKASKESKEGKENKEKKDGNDKPKESGKQPDQEPSSKEPNPAESSDDPNKGDSNPKSDGDKAMDPKKDPTKKDDKSENGDKPDEKTPDSPPKSEDPSAEKSPESNPKDPASDKPNDTPNGKPSDKPNEKPNDKPNNKPNDKTDDSKESDSAEADSPQEKQPSAPESREEKAKKRVEAAKKRMQKAQENLEQEKREEAVREQREAERELREAIEELEKILKQLREEEIERSLVDVETRLRKMLDLERSVREQTESLANLTGDVKDRTLEIQSNKLSIEQSKVVMEGQKALLLLQDEGSSTAFPEALEQVNSDARTVAKRLTDGNVSNSTRAIEDEIIGALEEMLESLKQVQKKRDEKKKSRNQQQQQQQQDDGSQPLVDAISELKLLKTLQLRVNRRTQTLAKQTDNQEDVVGQIADPNLRSELDDLANRQEKIHEVAREILLKATKERE